MVVEQVAFGFERGLGRGTVREFEKSVTTHVTVQRGVHIGVSSADECHRERALAAAIKNVNPRRCLGNRRVDGRVCHRV